MLGSNDRQLRFAAVVKSISYSSRDLAVGGASGAFAEDVKNDARKAGTVARQNAMRMGVETAASELN
jgi:hypothetical protein